MSEKYLYGASVQGIQSFIFQTNSLRDVVGASELVEQICTELFSEIVGVDSNIIGAAGNIRHIFEDKKKGVLEKVVREFPKRVIQKAPGVTVSQAVVKFEDDFEKASNELEKKLKVQRNRQQMNFIQGLLGVLRANQTGKPVVYAKERNRDYFDEATYAKNKVTDRENNQINLLSKLAEKSFNIDRSSLGNRLAYDIKHITDKNDWIAIIHADGNGIGKVVREIAKDKGLYQEFSKSLSSITEIAAQKAFNQVWGNVKTDDKVIPIRPVVLAGDDHTLIIRADLALPYVRTFLYAFEEESKSKLARIFKKNPSLNMDKLTACAGIAFIKSSYPFYYGYELAESLCSKAKGVAKQERFTEKLGIAPSCLMFHKVQDSFVESYAEISERELTTMDGNSLQFGPYFLNENQLSRHITIDKLLKNIEDLEKTEKGIRSGIRRWLSELHINADKAAQLLNRLKSVHEKSKNLIDELTNGIALMDNEKSPNAVSYKAYDALSIYTIMNQKTRDNKEEI